MKKELELYIHIPFCIKKCNYCDFLSFGSSKKEREAYLQALLKEIAYYRELAEEYIVTSIFIGGGTPTVMEGEQIIRLLQGIRGSFRIREEAEITIEVNPGTVTAETLVALKGAGVNRLSIGLQSADNSELERLGRIHTYEEFLETYTQARTVGFLNINVDLISSIPGQTPASWEETIRQVLKLSPPEHISAYSLIVEEGTEFYDQQEKGSLELPDEETERFIYRRTGELLGKAGYHRYEISNYARAGYECIHNLGYWERKEYLGLGLGAASLIDNNRFSNTKVMAEYLKDPGKSDQQEPISMQGQIEEFMFLGLRKAEGINVQTFKETFGVSVDCVYQKELDYLKNEQLLKVAGDYLALTRKGTDLANYVFAKFIIDED